MTARRVCVLGAGVTGLSSAVCILEQCPGVEITIVADKFSPNTTSDVSAGLWGPHCLGDTPEELIRQWGSATWDHLYRLFNSPDASVVGCQLLSGYTVADNEGPEYQYGDQVLGYRQLTHKELALFPPARWGTFRTTLQIDVTLYLRWLMARFKDQGGKIQQRRISSLDEVTDQYDVVVNCTGLGSYSLLGDKSLTPVRGQLVRLQAPWLKHLYSKGDTYILPGSRNVVVGGTEQTGDWNPDVDEVDSQAILKGAVALVPSLKDAKIESVSVGLRPVRTEVRLEREVVQKQGKATTVIHNYGHGGAGVTLHWGCAQQVARLVRETLVAYKL